MNFQIKTPALNHAEHVDLSDTMLDTSLSLHPLTQSNLYQHGLCGQVTVFDLTQVYITPAAKSAIKHAYLTELYLIEQYARHYANALFRTVNRGNDKGMLILDPSANTYVHCLSDGSELIAQGETVEVEGVFTRRLTIACRNELAQEVAA